MKVGILTGGGDCPGLNAVIRAIVRKGQRHYGDTLLGFADGWRGVIDCDFSELSVNRMRGTLPRGGTIIGTSRINPYMFADGVDQVKKTVDDLGLDAIVAIGGE
ncbi:MAG: 6-phosphofructokinase, partial [Acidimicrobiales bacterium]|nr:6-phosphofructokinase [Acidimicrobiales bacterium]